MSPTVELILRRAQEVGPRCGTSTVIAIDGPAGSGKTTLAQAVARGSGAPVIEMDDLYPGWGGMRRAGETVATILSTLARGHPATYRRYDWHAQHYAETHEVTAPELLIIDGVGAVRQEYAPMLSVIVMVTEPDPDERLRRGLQRDGGQAEPLWRAWMAEEAELHDEVGLVSLAHIVVDGHGTVVSGDV